MLQLQVFNQTSYAGPCSWLYTLQVLTLAMGKGHDSKDLASQGSSLVAGGQQDKYMHAQRVRMIDFCIVWTIDVCRQERTQILKVGLMTVSPTHAWQQKVSQSVICAAWGSR